MIFFMYVYVHIFYYFSIYWSDTSLPITMWDSDMIIRYSSHRRPAKAQTSLCIRAVSPESSLLAYPKYGVSVSIVQGKQHLQVLAF